MSAAPEGMPKLQKTYQRDLMPLTTVTKQNVSYEMETRSVHRIQVAIRLHSSTNHLRLTDYYWIKPISLFLSVSYEARLVVYKSK
ncbi:hypothetical protein J6590_070774 [Homalodisca vitripennis]|nr:hypothetical protein J6590_070774 [Homalodisca vitripennis]